MVKSYGSLSLIDSSDIDQITSMFLASANDSGITKQTAGWHEDTPIPPISESLPYLWYYAIYSANGVTVSETDPVIIGRYGADGRNGVTIDKVEYSKNGTDWSETEPTLSKGEWLYVKTTYTDETSVISKSYAGTDGHNGLNGRGIERVDVTYGQSANTTDEPAVWYNNVPSWDGSKPYYWVKTVTTYDTDPPSTYTYKYIDYAMTDANSTAHQAATIVNNLNQWFWYLSEPIVTSEGTISAGVRVTQVSSTDFKTNPDTLGGPNTLVRSDGIYLNDGLKILGKLNKSSLEFFDPTTTRVRIKLGLDTGETGNSLKFYYNTNSASTRAMVLANDSLTFYGKDSNTPTLEISSSGYLKSGNFSLTSGNRYSTSGSKIDLTNGDIITPGFRIQTTENGGISTTNVYVKGHVEAETGTIGNWSISDSYGGALCTNGYTFGSGILVSPSYTPNNAEAVGVLPTGKSWTITAGNKFGLATDGTLYATGANISGVITVSSGSDLSAGLGNYSTTQEVNSAISTATSNMITSVTTKDQYYLSTSATETIGGSWQDTVPTWSNGKYIWTRVATTKTTSSGSSTTNSTAVYDSALTSALSTAANAQTTVDSAAISVVTTKQYYLSTASTSATGGSWQDTIPSWSSGKYIWIRFKIETTSVSGTATVSYTPSESGVYDSALTTALSTADSAKTTADAAAPKTSAVYREQRIYRRYTSEQNNLSGPTTWVTTSTDTYLDWTTKIPPLAASTDSSVTTYPYLYTCVQTQTVTQHLAGQNECSCSVPLLDGTTTVINGGNIITGSISANKISVTDLSAFNATIGGWSINNNSIYTGSVGSTSGIKLSSSNFSHTGSIGGGSNLSNWRFTIGSGFGVTADGTLYANNAQISGDIVANSLTLGTNASINAAKVNGLSSVATSGNYNDLSNTPTIPDLTYYIYQDGTVSGTYDGTARSFTVSKQGLLTATNAVITGSITATSGTIGGWTINTNNNQSLQSSNGSVGLKGSGSGTSDIVFWAGSSTPTSAPFRVRRDGSATATSITIDGYATDSELSSVSSTASSAASDASSALTTASAASTAASNAEKTATNYISISGDGINVHGYGKESTNYITITSGGLKIYKSSNCVAEYGDTAVIGPKTNGQSRVEILSTGIDLLRRDSGSDIVLAHFGYATTNTSDETGSSTDTKPFYNLGTRNGTGSNCGQYSIVAGFNNKASGSYSVALGRNNEVTGFCGSALGYYNSVIGSYAFAGGQYLKASSFSQTVVGQCNEEDNSGRYAFIVGTGDWSGSIRRRNGFTVAWTGATVMNTTGHSDDQAYFTIQENGTPKIAMGVGSGGTNHGIISKISDEWIICNTSNYTRIPRAGSKTISGTTYVLETNSSGDLMRRSSSRRYKTDISNLTSPELNPEKLYDLRVAQFKYKKQPDKTDKRYDKLVPGFIAEEVAEIYPIAACFDGDKVEDWTDRHIIPPMLALIQKQHKEIEELKSRIEKLEGDK